MDQERRPRIPPKAKQKVAPKAKSSREEAHRAPRFQVPFTRKNYVAFAVGIALLLLGYIFLAQPPVEGFLSVTLAPVLLVISYCVVFPYAIMARDRRKTAETPKS